MFADLQEFIYLFYLPIIFALATLFVVCAVILAFAIAIKVIRK